MDDKFQGLKKDELDKLKRAVTTHERITGEKVDISSIPEFNEEDSLKEKQAASQRELDARAKSDRELEKAQQQARRIQQGRFDGSEGKERGDIQPGNTGPDQPAAITERAEEQGATRKGTEPATVTGREGSQNAAPKAPAPVSGHPAEKK